MTIAISAFICNVLRAVNDDPEIVEQLRRLGRHLAPIAPIEKSAPRLLTCAELAKALNVSKITITRADQAGHPFESVGSRRRYDLDASRAWFRARGRTSTLKKVDHDPIDISRAMRGAGLRAVGGVR